MTQSEKKLASRLLYLPLDLHEKVFLWLTYRELKPVSEITIIRRRLALLRRGVFQKFKDPKGLKANRIRKWLKDAGLEYSYDPKYPESWHIGKNLDLVKQSVQTIRKFTYESEYQTGILFGFPAKSAEAYAHNRIYPTPDDQIAMIWPGDLSSNEYLKDKYYLPYISYAIRADNIQQDLKVAKTWAKTIRTETPKLARWFERFELQRINRERKLLKPHSLDSMPGSC